MLEIGFLLIPLVEINFANIGIYQSDVEASRIRNEKFILMAFHACSYVYLNVKPQSAHHFHKKHINQSLGSLYSTTSVTSHCKCLFSSCSN